MTPKSSTYIEIIDMFFRFGQLARVTPVYGNKFDGFKYIRDNSGKTSHRIDQELYISDANLFNKCTSAEWHLVGRITSELKEYNALWHCEPELKKSSNVRKAIKGLLDKKILIKTETTDIYLVNPLHIRRGDTFAVLASTAKMLMDEPRVQLAHIRDKKPVTELDLSFEMLKLN